VTAVETDNGGDLGSGKRKSDGANKKKAKKQKTELPHSATLAVPTTGLAPDFDDIPARPATLDIPDKWEEPVSDLGHDP